MYGGPTPGPPVHVPGSHPGASGTCTGGPINCTFVPRLLQGPRRYSRLASSTAPSASQSDYSTEGYNATFGILLRSRSGSNAAFSHSTLCWTAGDVDQNGGRYSAPEKRTVGQKTSDAVLSRGIIPSTVNRRRCPEIRSTRTVLNRM